MNTVARDVPPTGTFSIGTGNASTNVEPKRRAARPASSAAEGSNAAKEATETTTAIVAPKSTGAMTGSRRRDSREKRSCACAAGGRLSPRVTSLAVDPILRPLPARVVPVASVYLPQLLSLELKQRCGSLPCFGGSLVAIGTELELVFAEPGKHVWRAVEGGHEQA